ncbi:uncharacterized protein BDR25DRAFT_347894 [Lindgomyces ingoldianus]|uniref:Uncharacterized protein n=1 Tax=Lindgomyces ingoldianus TaxID=673940 RepID=A0ACB6RED0_9PLEO|nr:uncharacterized protein BDR25DRAFT_347894 [Lindgomyces ingoldianus]KAF2477556.1 hypothetical protein BDR25DRAFT_347894 [Lindgomyces ingoldianus]
MALNSCALFTNLNIECIYLACFSSQHITKRPTRALLSCNISALSHELRAQNNDTTRSSKTFNRPLRTSTLRIETSEKDEQSQILQGLRTCTGSIISSQSNLFQGLEQLRSLLDTANAGVLGLKFSAILPASNADALAEIFGLNFKASSNQYLELGQQATTNYAILDHDRIAELYSGGPREGDTHAKDLSPVLGNAPIPRLEDSTAAMTSRFKQHWLVEWKIGEGGSLKLESHFSISVNFRPSQAISRFPGVSMFYSSARNQQTTTPYTILYYHDRRFSRRSSYVFSNGNKPEMSRQRRQYRAARIEIFLLSIGPSIDQCILQVFRDIPTYLLIAEMVRYWLEEWRKELLSNFAGLRELDGYSREDSQFVANALLDDLIKMMDSFLSIAAAEDTWRVLFYFWPKSLMRPSHEVRSVIEHCLRRGLSPNRRYGKANWPLLFRAIFEMAQQKREGI